MSAIGSLAAAERRLIERAPQPQRLDPMKARLTERRFSDPEWIFERKLDGVRCVAFRTPRGVGLRSRTDRVLNRSYPELVEALAAQQCDFVVDGEIVAFSGRVTSFSRLQRRMQIDDPERARRTGISVYLYLFDIVHLDGYDTMALPVRTRKRLLRTALSFGGPIRWLPHRNREGEALFADACKRGLEGLIAKRADSPYRPGSRSGDWLKLKCSHDQELVIGGFTAPKGSRTDFGALLVGYHEAGALRYAGKVGTGFDRETLERLGTRLRRLERQRSPFADVHPAPAGTHWVEPEIVAQFAFSEWTRDGRLRHPRYLGLRDDIRPSEVVRERPS